MTLWDALNYIQSVIQEIRWNCNVISQFSHLWKFINSTQFLNVLSKIWKGTWHVISLFLNLLNEIFRELIPSSTLFHENLTWRKCGKVYKLKTKENIEKKELDRKEGRWTSQFYRTWNKNRILGEWKLKNLNKNISNREKVFCKLIPHKSIDASVHFVIVPCVNKTEMK